MNEKYFAFNLTGDSPMPKSVDELVKKLSENIDKISDNTTKNNLIFGIEWIKRNKIRCEKLVGEGEYYRLGISSENGINFYSIQIWEKYFENIDQRKKNQFSNSNLDLDNDEDTIIYD